MRAPCPRSEGAPEHVHGVPRPTLSQVKTTAFHSLQITVDFHNRALAECMAAFQLLPEQGVAATGDTFVSMY